MQVMSISELIALGWHKHTLMQIAHSKGSPAFKTCGGGKWLFDVRKLERFLAERMSDK
jgi:hypothetical protein